MRAVFRYVLVFFSQPTVIGAAYMLALSAHAGTGGGEERLKLGEHAQAITDFVNGQYGAEIARITAAIVAAAVVVGAALGFSAGCLVWLRDALRGSTSVAPRTMLSRAWAALWITASLQALVELWAMAEAPQLYADGWYARGGIWRTIQVIATDVLGPRAIAIIGVLAIVVYVAGPPGQWKHLPARASAALARVRRRSAVGIAAAIAVAVAVFAICFPTPLRQAHAGAAQSAQPNVLIIAADSLRADRIRPALTPAICKLAERGTSFDRAYVSLPRTFPSWVTILTGRHPHHHGIRNMFPRWEERAKDFDALPERFAKAGYETAVVSDFAGDIFPRIELGFHTVNTPYFDFRQIVRQRALERMTPLLPLIHSQVGRTFFPVLREFNDAADATMLTRDAENVIHRMKDKPFFMTVFYSTAHFPYAAPAPYYRRFTDPAYRGRYKYYKPVGLGKEEPPDAQDIQQIRALYDGAVVSIDAAVGDLLLDLEREGIAGRTIVVVTADHGESLFDFDHGQGHGDQLFGDEGTHVPLIVYDPRHTSAGKNERASGIVRDVDLAPTLYELANVTPPLDLDGRTLVPALSGKPLDPALAYAETGLWFTEEIPQLPPAYRLPYPSIARMTEIDAQNGDEVVLQKGVRPLTIVAKHRMVRDERYKLVYVPTRSKVVYLLFDTAVDPGEDHDVAADHPEIVARLKGELWTWMLKDVQMAERSGYLVPRDVAALAERAAVGALRIGEGVDAPKGEGMP